MEMLGNFEWNQMWQPCMSRAIYLLTVVFSCLWTDYFLQKLTPDGSVLTLKTLLKDTFCKKLTLGGSVHRKCLKTLFSVNDTWQEALKLRTLLRLKDTPQEVLKDS